LTLGPDGIIERAKEAKEENAEQSAKEKLELEFANLLIKKGENPNNYNEEYFDNYLNQKGFVQNGNIVIVDGYQFQVDKSVPKIIVSLGKGEEIKQIDLTPSVEYTADYTKAIIKIAITYEQNIVQIKINGEEIQIPERTEGIYQIEKEVPANGNYSIYVKDENDGYKLSSVNVSKISENMVIKSEEGFVAFKDAVNKGSTFEGKTISLEEDLDLSSVCGEDIGSWEPIANYETNTNLVFKGTFNGNNHVISNLYISEKTTSRQGLFGTNAGTIENLTIENANVSTSSADTGILVGYNMAGGTINNVTVKGQLNVTSTVSHIGGVVGSNLGTVNQAINYASINSQYRYVGGIVGQNNQKAIVSSCYNYGTVTGKSDVYVGGICGSNENASTITQSYNHGTVTGTNNNIGGICGVNHNTSTISNSYNQGTVNGAYNVGGICGANQNTSTIEKSHNYAAVTGSGNVGGITGINTNNSYVKTSSNSMAINLGNANGVGGIVGINQTATITECFNKAKISSTGVTIGGIVGNNQTNAYITNCYNKGAVSTTGKDQYDQAYIGGIAGCNENTSTIKGCYNTGEVTSSYKYVGGIVGYNGNSSAGTQTVQNVFNTGTIKKSSTSASKNIGESSNYVGYLIGRYGSLSGKYGNTNLTTMSGWDQATITTNLSDKFTNDKKDDAGKWIYNEGYPILTWQSDD